MKSEILSNLDNAQELERLYRKDKSSFRLAFLDLFPTQEKNSMLDFWKERLSYESENLNWGNRAEQLFVITIAMMAGLIAKVPQLFNLSEETFYSRNIGFIVFPLLTAYFIRKSKLANSKIIMAAVATLTGLIFINSLPTNEQSDTLVLSCIHLIILLWGILGFAFVGDNINSTEKRLEYLKYNGDLIVMTGLILISGGIMSAATVGLFHLIGYNIEAYYFKYVGIFGIAAAPIVGTYLTQSNPHLVGKVSPVIAKIFSPLVLVMLSIYLVAIAYSGHSPYTDRDSLLVFNGLLLGVMAIIFFSISETRNDGKKRFVVIILLLLSVVTIMVNGIALSAILLRISQLGFTPNRSAVVGSNLLVLINLLMVSTQLFKALFKNRAIALVKKSIAVFLPIYLIWAIIVTFLFPFIFGFK